MWGTGGFESGAVHTALCRRRPGPGNPRDPPVYLQRMRNVHDAPGPPKGGCPRAACAPATPIEEPPSPETCGASPGIDATMWSLLPPGAGGVVVRVWLRRRGGGVL